MLLSRDEASTVPPELDAKPPTAMSSSRRTDMLAPYGPWGGGNGMASGPRSSALNRAPTRTEPRRTTARPRERDRTSDRGHVRGLAIPREMGPDPPLVRERVVVDEQHDLGRASSMPRLRALERPARPSVTTRRCVDRGGPALQPRRRSIVDPLSTTRPRTGPARPPGEPARRDTRRARRPGCACKRPPIRSGLR